MTFQIADAPVGPDPSTVTVPDTSVIACLVTAGQIDYELHAGLVRTERFDRDQGWLNYCGELKQGSGANISKSRNEVLRRFLDETDAEWAWLLDSDMVLKEDTLPRLLCAAKVSNAKVIGGLCCMIGSDGPIPTIFQLGDPAKGEVTRVMLDYPDNTVIQVAATGMACLLVHRSVLEHFREAFPNRNYPWIYEDEITGQWVSEDVMFTLRCNEAGFPVFVDCTTHVGHSKGSTVWWPSDIRRGRGFPDPKTYAIIPTRTWSLVADTIDQLQGQVDKIIILDNTDNGMDFGQYRGTNVEVEVARMPGAGIHEMWNAGIEWAIKDADQRRNVNLLVLNDDLRMGERFVPRMVEALRSDQNLVAVSGNYDGRTGPLVQEVTDICAGRYDGTGGFAGFAFITKGEWFQSGYRFPEECKWWYGDNDLVMAAQLSGVGKVGIAIDAHVEHLDGGGKTGGDWSQFAEQLDRDRAAFDRRWQHLTAPPTPTRTVTVLTSIYGGYDEPCPPVLQDGVRDYLLVTDQPTNCAPWTTVLRPRPDEDPRYAGKRAKYLPFEFTDADTLVWIDGRVQVVSPSFVPWLIDQMGDKDMAIYRHPMRTSILTEAEACLVENPAKYGGQPMIEQARSYLTDGYVDDRLWQTTFFALRRNDRTEAMGKRWMEEQDRYPTCLLDQIPLPPVIAECGVQVQDLPGGFWDMHGKLWVLRPHIDGT